jgi:multiple sugar transport system substrate-binding protein
MKFEKLFYIVISSIVVIAVILVSYIFPPFASQNTMNQTSKKIYFVDHISAAHQKVIQRFNEKYKDQIEVEAIDLPFEKFSTNERKELLARFLRSKSDRIDIFSVDQIWVPRFAKWAIPLERYFTKQQRNSLLESAMESCVVNDTLIAIPLYIDIALMYYRKDLLKKAGDSYIKKLKESITWDDFISLNKKLSLNQPFFIFQGADYEGLMCIFFEMLLSQDKNIMRKDSIILNTPAAKKTLQLLVDFVLKYNISPEEITKFKENESYRYFLYNNAVFLRGWTSFMNDYKNDTINPDVFANIEPMPTPHFKGFKPASIYGGWNLMISKYSTKIPEVTKFINFLISEEAQKILYENGGFLSINKEIYRDSVFLSKHKELNFYRELLSRGIHRPFLENYTTISDILSYYLNLALRKQISVSEALNKATEKINSETILLK